MKKYRKYRNSELAEMSQGQRLRALEAEIDRAEQNRDKLVRPRKLTGATLGAGLGLAGSVMAGAKSQGIATAATAGGILGYEAGRHWGNRVAKKRGHDPIDRGKKLGKRLDRIARHRGEPDIYQHEAYKTGMLRKISGDTGRIREDTLLGNIK
jgi:hypothetical protein